MDFYGEQNLNKFEAVDFRLQNISTTYPTAPAIGQLVYNITTKKVYVYTSTGWEALGGNFSQTNIKDGVTPVYVNSLDLKITSGTIEIDNITVQRSTPITIRPSNSSNFISGHGAPANNQWLHVYAYLSGTDFSCAFSNEAPNYSSTDGRTDGAMRYKDFDGTWHRYIGSIYYSNEIDKFQRYKNLIMWDVPKLIATIGTIGGGTKVEISCSAGMPAPSRVCLFRYYIDDAARNWTTFFSAPFLMSKWHPEWDRYTGDDIYRAGIISRGTGQTSGSTIEYWPAAVSGSTKEVSLGAPYSSVASNGNHYATIAGYFEEW